MSIAIKADKSLFELPKWGEDFTISEANYTTLDVSLSNATLSGVEVGVEEMSV
jgi:hypothetical protein